MNYSESVDVCCSSRSDKVQRKHPGEEGYDPYEYDDEGIDVGNEFHTVFQTQTVDFFQILDAAVVD